MKTLLLLLSISLTLLATSCSTPTGTQVSGDAATKSLLEGRHYVFQAQLAQPSRGSSRQLSSGYELRVSGDTLIAQLPYFGRAYQAPADLRGGGIEFTSTHYSYSIDAKRKGRWDITFTPQDVTDVRSLDLSVSADGYASLQVLSNNREPISFNGIVVDKGGRR